MTLRCLMPLCADQCTDSPTLERRDTSSESDINARSDSDASGSDTDDERSIDFSSTLLRYHLDQGTEGAGIRGLDETDGETSLLGTDFADETDGGTSLLDRIKNDLRLTKRGLKKALSGKQPNEDVNERQPSDRDAYGKVAVLHRLVTGHYTHKIDLVTTLITFSNADIDLTTSRGKTAFHLAVELGNVELMQNLASLGANVNTSDNNHCTPYETALKNAGRLSIQREMTTSIVPPKFQAYIPTEWQSNLSGWATGFHGGCFDTYYEYYDSTPLIGTEITRNQDMLALLEEVCAVSRRRGHNTEGASNHDPIHPVKKCCRQVSVMQGASLPEQLKMRLDRCNELAAPFVSIAAGDVSPDQAVNIVRRLQECATDQRRRGVRVLCLDGGGVRGLVQLEILRQIEEELDAKITDQFDYIVGTSTGGIIALAMVYGKKTVRQLQQLYLEMKDAVFHKKGTGLFERDTKKLEDTLKLWFRQDRRMDKKKHVKVLVSAVKTKTADVRLRWFNNFLDDSDSRELVWKVARYTSAAPFYFKSKDYYVDGGLLANNPSLHALTTIQTHLRSEGDSRGVSLVVSVGTGINPSHEYHNLQITNVGHYLCRNVRFLKFMGSLVDSHSVTCEASCHCMCEEQGIEYVRLNPSLATEVDPGETDNQKLLDMLWTTRKYLHQSEHLLNTLKQFFLCYGRN